MVSKKKTAKKNSSTKSVESKLYPISSKKPETRKQIFHAVGVMQTEQEASTPYHQGIYQQFTAEQIKTHIPQYNVVPYSGGADPKPLSAAQIQTRRTRSKNNTFSNTMFETLQQNNPF